MRWQLVPVEFRPELIYGKGSKNTVVDALSRLDKIDNLNNTNTNNNDKVEPTLESLSQNFALNKENILHPTSFKTIMRSQQYDKFPIEIAKEKPKDFYIKQFHRAGETYSLFCKHRKIMIPKQIQKTLVE